MITTGVAGATWRADVAPGGSVAPWDGSPVLEWFVAADDRWHVPAREPAVRQRRLSGTAVVETRVRVPTGDAVQRVFSIADRGGLTVVEIENESSLPIAVAFAGRDGLVTERPVAAVPIEGIELPHPAIVLPVGHRGTVRVAIAHGGGADAALPAALPSAAQVVNGWLALTSTASRLDLPAGDRGAALADAVVSARCEVVLGAVPTRDSDPATFAVAVGELVRLGVVDAGREGDLLVDLAAAVAAIARVPGWRNDVAIEVVRRVVVAAGDTRAAGDVERIMRRRGVRAARPEAPPDGLWSIPWVEEGLASNGRLLPYGLPHAWLGANFEVFGLPVGAGTRIDYAVRWHGDRPALLWETSGAPIELTAPAVDPAWRTWEARGETLWPAPAASFS